MAGFVGKVVQWFVNEHMVKFLAKNHTFQRMALKIDSFLTTNQAVATKRGEEMFKKGGDVLREQSSKVHEASINKSGFDVIKFVTEFKNEIMKDVAKIQKK